jgi:hypothetical protein
VKSDKQDRTGFSFPAAKFDLEGSSGTSVDHMFYLYYTPRGGHRQAAAARRRYGKSGLRKLLFALLIPVPVWRILAEEKVLEKVLPGYNQ